MKVSSIRRLIRAIASDSRGSGDLTVSLLLTAAGAVMVGLTVPALFRSSQAASRTFDNQVKVLERGRGTSSSGGSQSPWEISFGPDGVKASGPVGGGVMGSLSVGKGGISGGAQGGGSGTGTASTPTNGSGGGSGGPATGTGSLKDVAPKGNQALIDARM